MQRALQDADPLRLLGRGPDEPLPAVVRLAPDDGRVDRLRLAAAPEEPIAAAGADEAGGLGVVVGEGARDGGGDE